MSSPMVAGIIALWLQANPNLTPQDIKGIIQRTSKHPDTSLSYPNPIYGYGEIDAYAGLLDILGISNIEAISKNQPESVRFSVANGCLQLNFANINAEAEVVIYTTSGQKLLSQHITTTSETAHISLRHLPKGVYAVQVNSASKALKGSTLIRL
ncbi:MAG: T9SS type A sorting domain-containing protein, partial [Prevotella sp.]|nr:T9SS type A sorting domain-containing protein [Prevotella sp.]